MSKPKQLRADAILNRDRLIDVARKQFSKRDSAVTLEEIAHLAGVGIGTLYRHFPTREALVEAVYRSERDALMADGEAMLKRHPAFKALRMWMDRYTQFVATKHSMQDTLRAAFASRSGPLFETRAKLRATISQFLSAGIADGTIRHDVEADDLTISLGAIVLVTDLSTDRGQLRRVLDLLMDGLRPRS